MVEISSFINENRKSDTADGWEREGLSVMVLSKNWVLVWNKKFNWDSYSHYAEDLIPYVFKDWNVKSNI